ncbi:hypothetical protein MKZ38_006357 [Zalerion maritima]|uniref:gamma-glutamylcyclotransferase n=1 Tax=Zalerion maritima TaxID=339359 RepID=A0AAD5RVI3_9PEZI|nr:hypothetical protein MKZ38_006357 [Zalerion maritima]
MSASPSATSSPSPHNDPTTCVLRKAYDTELAPLTCPRSYPSIKSIPTIASDRLARAHPERHNHPLDRATVLENTSDGDNPNEDNGDGCSLITAPDAGETTVLYLAYGSNLAAKTFLGVRGIRPLSQVNVTAPSLTLTFDLPGLPYREPCFANTAPRVLKKPGKYGSNKRDPLPGGLPDPPDIPDIPGVPKLPPALIGVVYEVTPSDYAKIVATEGGGASYAQIVVPCLPLPPSVTIPEKPVVPDPPKPFLARTLCMPRIPDVPDRPDDDDNESSASEAHCCYTLASRALREEETRAAAGKEKKWYSRFLLPHQRPDPGYAQPSSRYLSLLRTGAIEHDLPQSYQDHLFNDLQAYAVTSLRQRLGRLLLSLLWAPPFAVLFAVGKVVGGEDGRSPGWLVAVMTVAFNLVWWSYDVFFEGIFGDGERTEDAKEDDGNGDGDGIPCWNEERPRDSSKTQRRKSSVAKKFRTFSGTTKIVDEEKKALLSAESDSD